VRGERLGLDDVQRGQLAVVVPVSLVGRFALDERAGLVACDVALSTCHPGPRSPRANRAFIDPVAIALSKAILAGQDSTAIIEADLRDPAAILAHGTTRRLIDFRHGWYRLAQPGDPARG
jgi:S-adenosyl methyltransferase